MKQKELQKGYRSLLFHWYCTLTTSVEIGNNFFVVYCNIRIVHIVLCSSKKWNKFDMWILMLAGLTRSENSKLENLHVMVTSNVISAVDLADGVLVQELNSLASEGIVVYDAYLQQDVLIVAPILCIICDNPRASELMNHAGSSARKYCRMCLVKI